MDQKLASFLLYRARTIYNSDGGKMKFIKLLLIVSSLSLSTTLFSEGPVYNFNFYNKDSIPKNENFGLTNQSTENTEITENKNLTAQEISTEEKAKKIFKDVGLFSTKMKDNIKKIFNDGKQPQKRGWGFRFIGGSVGSTGENEGYEESNGISYDNENEEYNPEELMITRLIPALMIPLTNSLRLVTGYEFATLELNDREILLHGQSIMRGGYFAVEKDFQITDHFFLSGSFGFHWIEKERANQLSAYNFNSSGPDDNKYRIKTANTYELTFTPNFQWGWFGIGIDLNVGRTLLKVQRMLADDYSGNWLDYDKKYYTTVGGALNLTFFI